MEVVCKMTERLTSLKGRIDLTLSAHNIRRDDIRQADTEGAQLIITYQRPGSQAETQINLVLSSREQAFEGYLLLKNEPEYGLKPETRVQPERTPRRFDVA